MKHLLILFFLPLQLLAQGKSVTSFNKSNVIGRSPSTRVRDNTDIGLWGSYRQENKKPLTIAEDEPIPGKFYTFSELLWLNRGLLIGYQFQRDSLGVERARQPYPMRYFDSDTIIRRCPDCVKQGLRSKLFVERTTMTAMNCGEGHYDEQGQWVSPPDCNYVTTECACSEGHRFTYSRKGSAGGLRFLPTPDQHHKH